MDRTDSKINTAETHESSRKVLAQMLHAYEAAQPSCKGSMGLSLRKVLKAVNGGVT